MILLYLNDWIIIHVVITNSTKITILLLIIKYIMLWTIVNLSQVHNYLLRPKKSAVCLIRILFIHKKILLFSLCNWNRNKTAPVPYTIKLAKGFAEKEVIQYHSIKLTSNASAKFLPFQPFLIEFKSSGFWILCVWRFAQRNYFNK